MLPPPMLAIRKLSTGDCEIASGSIRGETLMRIRWFLFLSGCAVSLQAQSVRENPPQPDGRRLRLGTDTLAVFVVRQGQQQRTGLIIDRLDTVRVDGEVRLRRVYLRVDAVLGDGVDTLVDHFPDLTLRGVRSRSEGGGTETLDWRAGRLTGIVAQPGKPPRTIDMEAPRAPYSSASFDLILRASDLSDGYAVAMPAYSGRQGARNLSARVAGSDVQPGFGDTWRVEADFAGLSVTFWIVKTSRRVVRQVIRATPGTELLLVAK